MATISIRPAPAKEFHCYGNGSCPDNIGLWLRTAYYFLPSTEQNSPRSGSRFMAQRSLPSYLTLINKNCFINWGAKILAVNSLNQKTVIDPFFGNSIEIKNDYIRSLLI